MFTMPIFTMPMFLVLVAAYLLGSIPFGLVFTRLAGKGDIRAIGSGNIGTTNVLRTGSKLLAALTLIFDAGKGAVAVIIAGIYGDSTLAAIAGAAAITGHCFPVWLRFQGGKGVATALAVYGAFDWRLGALFILLWLGTAAIFRFSSLAALVATMGCTIFAFVMGTDMAIALAVLALTGLVWIRHHQNIGRLLSGTESKIGAK